MARTLTAPITRITSPTLPADLRPSWPPETALRATLSRSRSSCSRYGAAPLLLGKTCSFLLTYKSRLSGTLPPSTTRPTGRRTAPSPSISALETILAMANTAITSLVGRAMPFRRLWTTTAASALHVATSSPRTSVLLSSVLSRRACLRMLMDVSRLSPLKKTCLMTV